MLGGRRVEGGLKSREPLGQTAKERQVFSCVPLSSAPRVLRAQNRAKHSEKCKGEVEGVLLSKSLQNRWRRQDSSAATGL